MTLQQAIKASEYDTAKAEYNGMYAVVDGSSLDRTFGISIGVRGMPASEYEQALSFLSAERYIKGKGLLDQDWEPVGEDL